MCSSDLHSRYVPHITNQLNESYFPNTLYGKKNYTNSLHPKSQLNSANNSAGPQPLDQKVQSQSTTLSLILLGVFIVIARLMYFKFVERSSCITWKDKNNLEMEDKAVGDTCEAVKEERVGHTAEVGD